MGLCLWTHLRKWMMITWQRYSLKIMCLWLTVGVFWWLFSLSECCICEMNVFFLFNSGPLSGYRKVPKSGSRRFHRLLRLMVRAEGKAILVQLKLWHWGTEAFSNGAVRCVHERTGEEVGCSMLTESHGLSSRSCTLTASVGSGRESQG